MRAVALQMIAFMYIVSVSIWIVDEAVLKHTSVRPTGLQGAPLETATLINGTEQSLSSVKELRETSLNLERDDTILDRINDFAASGYHAVWLVLELLAGSYIFYVLGAIGLPAVFVSALQIIFPLIVASQVIWYVAGRY